MQSVSAVSTDTDVGDAQILITMLTSSLDSQHSSLVTRKLVTRLLTSLVTHHSTSSLDVTRPSTFVREEQHQQERAHTARTQANSVDIQRLRLCPVSTKDSNETTIHVDSTGQHRSHTPDHSRHARSSSIFLLFSHPHVSISVK